MTSKVLYPRNTDLTKRQRETFGKRLLKLANLIQSISPQNYTHDTYLNSCGTAGCSLGHAVANRKLFPGLKLRISKFKQGTTHKGFVLRSTIPEDIHGMQGRESFWADDYFGPDSYDRIMHTHAYGLLADVTPKMVVKRIRAVAKQAFGVTE